jgi:hypothetical protein
VPLYVTCTRTLPKYGPSKVWLKSSWSGDG